MFPIEDVTKKSHKEANSEKNEVNEKINITDDIIKVLIENNRFLSTAHLNFSKAGNLLQLLFGLG